MTMPRISRRGRHAAGYATWHFHNLIATWLVYVAERALRDKP